MLFQLGDKVYQGLHAPHAWTYRGSEANIAEHALINSKPRVQHTGVTLEELSLTFRLRANYCDPAQEILMLEGWKDKGEVLPLLLGNGDYRSDYLIKSISKTINETFSDGSIIDATITLVLLEHIAMNTEAQQLAEDRANGLAVGAGEEQSSRRPPQPPSQNALAHAALMEAQIDAWNAGEEARRALEADDPLTLVDKAHKQVVKAQAKMDEARRQINAIQARISGGANIILAINRAKDRLSNLDNLLKPPINLSNLDYGIIDLDSSISGIDTAATGFTNLVILRKP